MVARILFFATFALSSVNLLVFFSENTQSSLISFFQENLSEIIGNSITFDILFFTASVSTNFSILFRGDLPVVIDATYDINLSQYLLAATEENHILNLSLDSNIIPTGAWQYHLHTAFEGQLSAIEEFLNYLGLSQIAMISTNTLDSIKISNSFEEDFLKKVKLKVSLTDTLSSESTDNIAGRLLKPNGMQNFIMFCEGSYIDIFVTSLINKKIYKAGASVLIWSQGIWGGTNDGLLYLVEQGLEMSASYLEYEALTVKAFTSLVIEYINTFSSSQGPNIDSRSLKQYMDAHTDNHYRFPIYSLVNIVNSLKVKVGTVTKNQISLSSQIIYPGNSTAKPSISKAPIIMSLTSSGNEPDGTYNSYQPIISQGNFFARDWINNSSLILENFKIVFTENSCGTSVFIHDKAVTCYTPLKDELGLFFLGSDYYAADIGVMLLLREWNISMAHVDTATSPLLSNKTLYPEFMRVVPSGSYNAVVLVKLCQIFGWNNVNVVYANLSTNIAMYNTFVSEATKVGITIANDETKRILPQNYARTMLENYRYVFQAVKDTKVRIFITFQGASSSYQAVEGLYDVGMRKGDAVVVLSSKTGGQAIIQNYVQEYLTKLLELLCGCISVSAVEYTGEFGNEIKNSMASYWGSSPSFKGSHFDQTLLAAYGVDFAIKKGEDFENAAVLIKSTRAQRITGASGTIAIDSTSNDRSYMILSINNFYASNQTGVYNESVPGYYIPTSSTPIQISSNIIWPGPSYNVPSDTIALNSDCPFDQSLSEDSTKGIATFATICFSLALISFIMTFIMWKRGFPNPYPKLTDKREIQFADSFAMFTMIVEAFQYINIGPKFEKDPITEYLGSLSNISVEQFTSMKGSTYWLWLDIMLGIICFWFINCLVSFMRNQEWINKLFVVRWLLKYREIVIPLLGNTFFIAIINILLSVFKCSKSIGSDLDTSYMDIDCHEFCWQGTHIGYAIVSIFVLLLYLPISILLRPMWTNLKLEQNLRCQPEYLTIKSAVQVIYIALNKAISIYSKTAQGFIYLSLIIVFIVYNVKKPPFNYDRMNMWQIILLCCVCWSVLLTSISSGINKFYLELVIVKVVGWAVMVGLGLALQAKRFPGLLIRPQPPNIAQLFRFMLTSAVRADSLAKRNLKFASGKYEMKKESEIAPSSGKTEVVTINHSVMKLDDKTRMEIAEEYMLAEESANV
ncbi:unnamed protein product [Blepharisma stoltei]|uniref:Receptor ligand binding region domain-containing protein n=1 Tax=Blepharisma stoltei TaxID=1481888 RepID=A0AAU9J8C4_9CILI|nr:unnamed protein product [Blepharisma stoltei]